MARAATPTRVTLEATQFTVQNGQVGEAFAVCPGIKRVVGVGVVQSGSAQGIIVRASGLTKPPALSPYTSNKCERLARSGRFTKRPTTP